MKFLSRKSYSSRFSRVTSVQFFVFKIVQSEFLRHTRSSIFGECSHFSSLSSYLAFLITMIDVCLKNSDKYFFTFFVFPTCLYTHGNALTSRHRRNLRYRYAALPINANLYSSSTVYGIEYGHQS